MAETPPTSPIRPDPIRPAQAPKSPAAKADGVASPAFRALLERLEARADELAARSETLEDPALLPGAVDDARATLEDALSLGDRLLEAYREARQRRPGDAREGRP